MNFRDKMARFMYGRYGLDNLSKFMLVVTFILCVVSWFVPVSFSRLISTLIMIFIIIIYFRMFSRNIYKRAAENEKYLKFTNVFKKKYNSEKKMAGQKKYYHFYKCPGCGQKIRIPKGHGKIQIRCPKCGATFIKRS